MKRNIGRIGLCTFGLTLFVGVSSCRKEPSPVAGKEAAETKSPAGLIAEADRLYAGREDLIKVRQGIVALRQAELARPGNYDAAWRLAKFNYYLGSHTTDAQERDKAYRDGIQAGQLAVKLQDAKPDGHFWLGANYGGSAQASLLAGLAESENTRSEMETVLKLDKGYEGGSAYMVLGQLYLESPRLIGGDIAKAIGYLETGLRLHPNNVMLRFHLAEAYVAANRRDDARKQIGVLMSMKPDPDHVPEDNEALARARKLLEKIK